MYMVDVSSYPGIAITNPIDGGSYPVKAGSFPVNAGSYPLRCRSRCPCIATSHPDAYPVHYPIDRKSTLHQRKIHHPSTELITPSTPLLYGPKHLATPTPHSHHRLTVSPISFFSFSFAFCSINFPFAPGHQQPYPQPYSRSLSLVFP